MKLTVTQRPCLGRSYAVCWSRPRSLYEQCGCPQDNCGCSSFTVECELSDTVYQLKLQIEKMTSVPTGQQVLRIPPERMFTEGIPLLDSDPLAHYHLQTGQNLDMSVVNEAPVPEQSISEPDYGDLLRELAADQSGISKITGCIQVPLSL